MGGQVSAQPLLLRRALLAAADVGALGVERDDVPCAQVIAVVPLVGVSRPGTEVGEVAPGFRRTVLVVAWHGKGHALDLAPPRPVEADYLFQRPPRVLVVPR